MPEAYTIRSELPLDRAGNVMQAGGSDDVQIVDLTTSAWAQIPVPAGVMQAVLWAVADGAATTIAWMYGGARAGAPATGLTVPTGLTVTAQCANAPYIYAKAVGAAADLQIKWIKKEY